MLLVPAVTLVLCAARVEVYSRDAVEYKKPKCGFFTPRREGARTRGMSFVNAPVSKGLITTVTACSVLAAFTSHQYLFNVPALLLVRDHQFWRIPLHHFAFTNSSELFVGVLLLAFTSLACERAFGSIKYAVSLSTFSRDSN